MTNINSNSVKVNQDVFNALKAVKNPTEIMKQEALNIRNAILKDGKVDSNEQILLNKLTANSNSVRVSTTNTAGFEPNTLTFSGATGESKFILQELSQVGSRYEDIKPSEGMSWKRKLGLATDITGIIDPSPISDGISAGISISDGDWVGAGLSVASIFPYIGDAAAKPIKIFKELLENFPNIKRVIKSVDDIPRLFKNLEKLGPGIKNPTKVVNILNTMDNMHKAAANAYKNEKWLKAAKKFDLPTDGPIPFVPPKRWDANNPIKTPQNGFMDAFGNEWRKGPSRTAGETFEWDVIPKNKSSGIADLSRDGSHVNISLTGDVTHR